MITHKDALTVGVSYKGKQHKDFELRPQLVRDSVDLEEEPRAAKSDAFYGVCLLTKQIAHLGEIPADAITPDLVMDMTEVDFKVLMQAKAELESRLKSFRGKDKGDPADDAGTA